MKLSLWMRSFLEAAGVTAYVFLFALTVQNVQNWFVFKNVFPDPVLSIILFLLAFVMSAAVCGSLILFYPLHLFFEGKKENAWSVFFMSITWLAFFLALFGVLALTTG